MGGMNTEDLGYLHALLQSIYSGDGAFSCYGLVAIMVEFICDVFFWIQTSQVSSLGEKEGWDKFKITQMKRGQVSSEWRTRVGRFPIFFHSIVFNYTALAQHLNLLSVAPEVQTSVLQAQVIICVSFSKKWMHPGNALEILSSHCLNFFSAAENSSTTNSLSVEINFTSFRLNLTGRTLH